MRQTLSALRTSLLLRDICPDRFLPRTIEYCNRSSVRTNDLNANALLLMRATGIRIRECIGLRLDCLRQAGTDAWALHVPIGKLHSERLVPVDAAARSNIARILELRSLASPAKLARSRDLLLPRLGRSSPLYHALRAALADAGRRAACSCPVKPHQLRHTFATEMIRLGVSLPAVMQLLGHKDMRMTLRYVQVTQHDLQREFHKARLNASQAHRLPVPSVPNCSATADLPGIRQTLNSGNSSGTAKVAWQKSLRILGLDLDIG